MKTRLFTVVTLILILFACRGPQPSKVKETSLALTPPLGWNSFNSYGVYLHEEAAMANLEAFAEKLKPHGYEYFVIDAGWFGEFKLREGTIYPAEKHAAELNFNEYGLLQPSKTYFPNGLQVIIDRCHELGMKFGIHLMRGIPRAAVQANTPVKGTNYTARDIADTNSICTWNHQNYGIDMSRPGAQEFYNSLVNQMAEWGVDFLKYDDLVPYPEEVQGVVNAIAQCGRSMVLSLSPGGDVDIDNLNVFKGGNMLRVTPDIWDEQKGIDQCFQAWRKWQGKEEPGFWIDMDMIPFGQLQLMSPRPEGVDGTESRAELRQKIESGELSNVELLAGKGWTRWSEFSKDQMYTFITLRALAASPLMMGGDLPTLDDFSLELITNRDVLECNQNGVMGSLVYEAGGIEIWNTPKKDNRDGWIGIFNLTQLSESISLQPEDLGLDVNASYSLKDLWNNVEVTSYDFSLNPNAVVFLKYSQLAEPPVKAPFQKLDTYCTNDWWMHARDVKDSPDIIVDVDVPRDEVICFGIYTVHDQVVKMSAQLFPLYPDEIREVRLELKKNRRWKEVATENVNDLGWSATFRIENWDDTRDVPYRLRHGENAVFEGLIRRNPVDKNEIVVACLNCNSNKDRGLREEYTRNVNHFDPDLVFFAGDQSYDHTEHTAAWLLFGLQFWELFRERPCITIPDDHDIGQGNLWGEGGKIASSPAGDDGGYFYHHEYVKMVERCQTSHLPDPYDPTPIKQGIGVYYTSLNLGGIDFAIIEDRKFKSGPAGKIPQQGPRPDHVRNPDYDLESIDLEGLTLLGDRQLAFLRDWGKQEDGVSMKAVFSQTGFCGGAHRHGTFENYLHADLDCNGWPQTGRKKALKAIQDAGAVHLAGDQHLATLIQHGIKEHRDGPFAFVAPATVNNIYRRWWHPLDEQAGKNRDPKNPLPFTGDYVDGLGNKITMHAYANIESQDLLRDGFGIVRFNKKEKSVTFESWDRFSDVTNEGARQMPGWPRTIRQTGSGNNISWQIDPLQ